MTDRILNTMEEGPEHGKIAKPYEKLTISNFFIFSKVMSNPEICREFLQRVFPGMEIGKAVPVAESFHQVSPGLKGVRFDVYARDGGHLFDIENCIRDGDHLFQYEGHGAGHRCPDAELSGLCRRKHGSGKGR